MNMRTTITLYLLLTTFVCPQFGETAEHSRAPTRIFGLPAPLRPSSGRIPPAVVPPAATLKRYSPERCSRLTRLLIPMSTQLLAVNVHSPATPTTRMAIFLPDSLLSFTRPLPLQNFRHVPAMGPHIVIMLDELVAHALFNVGRFRADCRHPIHNVVHQMKAVQVVHDQHVKWSGGWSCDHLLILLGARFAPRQPAPRRSDPVKRGLRFRDWSNILVTMREIGASDFKARCLALIDEVGETGSSIVISKRGRQVAQLVPYTSVTEAIPQETLRGTATFTGDVEGPVTTPEEWDAVVAEQP